MLLVERPSRRCSVDPVGLVIVTPMPRQTVAEVLACFEDEFATASSAFAHGGYALWLGSGISRDVVPGVDQLLLVLLNFIQVRIDPADDHCRFRSALDEILDIAEVPATLRDPIDFAQPVETWPGLSDLIVWLRDKYAAVLDVRVKGEQADFLVWDGIDAASTYGAPDLHPDVEHLCVAILMLEGVVRSVPTTNWDGLIEAAVSRLAAQPDRLLRVVIVPADFSSPERSAELVKFHGCAVRALAAEEHYRGQLIARESQISGWAAKPDNKIMKERLEFVLASKPAFVVGLSAQDADIHTMFNQASQNLVRTWPVDPPAMVCVDQQLGPHHKHMLKVVYGDEPSSNNGAEINASALLGAYAKPALLALVLYVLTDKLRELLASVSDLALVEEEVARMQDDIRLLRDEVSTLATGDTRSFVENMITVTRLVLSAFRDGNGPAADATHYEPLTVKPAAEALDDPNFPGDALGRFAIAVALLARGHLAKEWTLSLEHAVDPGKAVIRVTSEFGRISDVFIVKDAGVLSRLEANELVDVSNSDVLIVYAESVPGKVTRSPRSYYGRTGSTGSREVDLEVLAGTATTADALFENFKLEGAL